MKREEDTQTNGDVIENSNMTMSKVEVFSVESSQVKGDTEYTITSAHTIDHDSWKQVGLMLITGYNTGYILSYSNLLIVPLGWAWGLICLFVMAFFAAYANVLLSGFHFIDGQRFIRYRDLMGFIFGKKMYYTTWILQFLTLVLGNMGFILLGGRALKEINSEFADSTLRLQYFILMTGLIFFGFAILVPTMSAMRSWMGISSILTLTYVIILLVILVKDGKYYKKKEYNIKGTQVDKVFNAFSAFASILVCNTSGMLPEIQSTLRKPVVKNMRKALYSQFSIGLLISYGVSIVGYWAYGSSVSEYLPKEISGPKWAKVLINSMVFIQSVISQHIFITPIYEALDTKFLKLDEKIYSVYNLKRLLLLRLLFFTYNTFVTAAFPFMGDFINVTGSFALFPLTFVFPSMIFLKVKGKIARKEHVLWHWANIVFFFLMAVATSISAVKLMVNNIKIYKFFADT